VSLPRGEKRAEIEHKIKDAEDILRRSDAKLARELGMKLCGCTFPPQIMLWRETERAHVCPNPECGWRRKQATSACVARGGGNHPYSWMAS
jgi:hypothetical protein